MKQIKKEIDPEFNGKIHYWKEEEMKHKHIWVSFKARWTPTKDKLRIAFFYDLTGIYFKCEKCGAVDLVKIKEPKIAYVKEEKKA